MKTIDPNSEDSRKTASKGWNLKREIASYLRTTSRTRGKNSGHSPSESSWRTRLPVLLILFSTIVSLIGCENQENQKRGMVTGVILDTQNHMIPDALVTSHRSLFQAKTGTDGRYSFTSLDPGSHRLTVDRLGFKSASATINILSAEVHEEINFKLEPLPNQISWIIASRTVHSVTIDATTLDSMKCQLAYQGEHLPQIRTPFSSTGTEHRFVITPLLPNIVYRFFIEGQTSDKRYHTSASGSFRPVPEGDVPGAPPAPQEFKATQTPSGMLVSWSLDTTDPIQGFRVYRAEEDEPFGLWQDENFLFGNQRSVADADAKPGVLTRYAIEAVDLDGNVSSRTLPLSIMPGGSLKRDVTWRQKWGSIDLNGDIWVPEGLTLRIERGLIVRVSPTDYSQSGIQPEKCEMVVEGRLVVAGENTAPVRFISAAALPNRQDWAGIRIRTAQGKPGSYITHLEIFNAENGIAMGFSPASITSYLARYCETGFRFQNASGTSLTDLGFFDCAKGIAAVDSWDCSIASFVCDGGDVGVSFQGNRNMTLRQFDIRNTLDTGLHLSDAASMTVENGVVASRKLGVYLNGGVATATFLTVDAVNGILVDQGQQPGLKNCILVNNARPNTGNGLEDRVSIRSYPYNTIFNFLKTTLNCDQNGGPILNVDPLFIGGTAGPYDYHLQETSPLLTASDIGAEIGAYGAP